MEKPNIIRVRCSRCGRITEVHEIGDSWSSCGHEGSPILESVQWRDVEAMMKAIPSVAPEESQQDRLDRLTNRAEQLKGRLNGIMNREEEDRARMQRIEERLDALEGKVGSLECHREKPAIQEPIGYVVINAVGNVEPHIFVSQIEAQKERDARYSSRVTVHPVMPAVEVK